MNIILQTAHEATFPTICELITSEQELFFVYPRGTFPITPEQLQQLAKTRLDLTVAIEDGEVIGFANLYDLEPGQWAFIGNVIIAKRCRGRGYGQQLIEHMFDLAVKKYALPEVRISVFSHNIPALLLYSRLGFVPHSVEPRFDYAGNRVALLHMRCKHDGFVRQADHPFG